MRIKAKDAVVWVNFVERKVAVRPKGYRKRIELEGHWCNPIGAHYITNKAGSQNFNAKEAEKEPIVGIMNHLHQQAFHPGKQRTAPNDARRVGLYKVNKVNVWVEGNTTPALLLAAFAVAFRRPGAHG